MRDVLFLDLTILELSFLKEKVLTVDKISNRMKTTKEINVVSFEGGTATII